MKRQLYVLLPMIVFTTALYSQITTTHGKLKLVHARATLTKAKVRVAITEPANGQVLEGPDAAVKFTLENWKPEDKGNHLHFLLDEQPYQDHYSSEPFVFRNLEPGPHVIRVFPVYGWHDSVKQQESLAMVQFYVKEKKGNLPLDRTRPMMIYNAPVGVHDSNESLPGQPHSGILIDWFLHDVTMGGRTGYLVRISVDGENLTEMKEWRPHYLQQLPAGEHSIKLELLKNGKPVTENWSVTERKITVR